MSLNQSFHVQPLSTLSVHKHHHHQQHSHLKSGSVQQQSSFSNVGIATTGNMNNRLKPTNHKEGSSSSNAVKSLPYPVRSSLRVPSTTSSFHGTARISSNNNNNLPLRTHHPDSSTNGPLKYCSKKESDDDPQQPIPRRTPSHARSKSLHHPSPHTTINVSASSCGIGSTTEIIFTSKNRQSMKGNQASTTMLKNSSSNGTAFTQNGVQKVTGSLNTNNRDLMYTSPCYGYRSHHDKENAHEEKENLLSPTWKDEMPLVKAALLVSKQKEPSSQISTPKKEIVGDNMNGGCPLTPNSLKRRNTTALTRLNNKSSHSSKVLSTPVRSSTTITTPSQTKQQVDLVNKLPSCDEMEQLDDESSQYEAFKKIKNIEAISFATATPTEVWCGEKKGVIVIFDIKTCNVIQTIREEKRVYVSCMCSFMHSNGSQQQPLMWAGMADGTINIYSIKPKRLLRTLVGHTGTVTAIVGLNEGLVATCSVDFTIRLWDTLTFTCKNSYVGLKSWVNTLCSVGPLLWSGSDDATIRVWNVLEERTSPMNEVSNQTTLTTLNQEATFTTNESQSIAEASASQNSVTENAGTSKRHMYGVTQLCYCSKTNTVWSSSRDCCVKIWSTTPSSIQCEKCIQFPSFVNCMHIADDNIWIATHREISVWNVSEKKLLGKYRIEGFVTCISTVGDSVWIACSDKSILVYKLHAHRKDDIGSGLDNQETHFTRRKRVSASRRLSSEFNTCASDLMDFEDPIEQTFEEEIDFSKTQQDEISEDLKEEEECDIGGDKTSSLTVNPLLHVSPIKGDLSSSPLFVGDVNENEKSIFCELHFDDIDLEHAQENDAKHEDDIKFLHSVHSQPVLNRFNESIDSESIEDSFLNQSIVVECSTIHELVDEDLHGCLPEPSGSSSCQQEMQECSLVENVTNQSGTDRNNTLLFQPPLSVTTSSSWWNAPNNKLNRIQRFLQYVLQSCFNPINSNE
nr:unnamed protein product [Naegleria fowleri]